MDSLAFVLLTHSTQVLCGHTHPRSYPYVAGESFAHRHGLSVNTEVELVSSERRKGVGGHSVHSPLLHPPRASIVTCVMLCFS